ncbi:hypothetical protein D3C81_2257100 [compost metagenome]
MQVRERGDELTESLPFLVFDEEGMTTFSAFKSALFGFDHIVHVQVAKAYRRG